MPIDDNLLAALRADLAALTALHAPSGAEQPVIARLRELFAPRTDEPVSIDGMGNLTARRHGQADAPSGRRGWRGIGTHR